MARSSGIGALGGMGDRGDGPERRKRVLEDQKPRPGAIRTVNGQQQQFVETRGMLGATGPFGWINSALGGDDTPSIGRLARPSGNESPPRDNAEFQQRVQRNTQWAQAPEVQAALLQFAVNMMQPVNSPQDLMLNLSQGVGGAVQAASRVREGTLEEQKAAREAEIEERKMKVSEGGLTVAEKRLAIDQAELGLKLKKGTTKSVVVSADDAINARFKLGIPKGSRAKVQITVDDEGKVTDASVEAGFEGGGSDKDLSSGIEQLQKDRAEAKARGDTAAVAELDKKIQLETTPSGEISKSSTLEQLQIDREEALARGDTKAAGELDLKIKTEGAGEGGVKEGRILVPSATDPSGFEEKIIPGSKADLEAKEAKKMQSSQWMSGAISTATVNTATKTILDIFESNPMPNVTVTGLAGLAAELPIPSDARRVRNALETIKSNVTVTTLTNMRLASPTGAAFGNVSDFENLVVQRIMGTLDQMGDAEDLKNSVQRVASVFRLTLDGGQIQAIGEQVKAGILTPDQALLEVERLIDQDITKDAEKKAETAREVARAGSASMQTPEFNPRLTAPTPLSNNPQPMTMTSPTPPVPAVLTPEEKTQANVLEQMNAITSTIDPDAPEPTMPLDLSESDQEDWQDLDPMDRKIFIEALKAKKNKKRGGKNPPGSRHETPEGFVGDLTEEEQLDADALKLWDSVLPRPRKSTRPIEIDPKTLGPNSPLRRK